MVDYGSFEDGVRFASLADEIDGLHTKILFVIGRDESIRKSAQGKIRLMYDEYVALSDKYDREIPADLTRKFEDSVARH